MTLFTNPTALQIVRMIQAPRERVYAAWTDTSLALRWWGAEGCETEELDLDAWRGGTFRWLLTRPDGKKSLVRGKYHTVQPPKKIVHTWQWVDAPAWKDAWSLVSIEFLEKENGTLTELRLVHDKLPNEESRDGHIGGWNSALDRLERLFAEPS
ncbi:SRPBCC domain-containing protein [Prosthecobacter sp.]|uniref:SRPBCC domain-containing protein n=1 Tax=Prosthecobacter sp. TaxID=1965333 RepID=UPI003783CE26